MGARAFVKGRNRGVAYAARGHVHYPLEAFVVVRIYHELEVCHHVLDFRTVEEGIAGVDHVGHVAAAELFLERTRLRVGAVEDGKVLILGLFLLHPGDDVGYYHDGLVLLGPGLEEFYLFSTLVAGVAFFGDAALVMGDDSVCRLHYIGSGAVVAFQSENLALGIVLLEVQDILDAGTAEGVYALGIIAHDADIVVSLGKLLEDEILGKVGVLVLIHQYIGEAGGYLFEGLGIVLEQNIHLHQDVVEVHHSTGLEFLLIKIVDVADARLLGCGISQTALRICPISDRSNEVILSRRNAGEHFAGLVYLIVQLQLFYAGLYCRSGIRLVVDGEVFGITETLGIVPQEPHEHGVEGAHDEPAGASVAHHGGDTLLHFARGLFSEGEGKYTGRVDVFRGKDVGNSGGENPGFARAGTGHYQYRAVDALHRLPLGPVQPLEDLCRFVFHCRAKIRRKIGRLTGRYEVS